jgi:thioredoxin-like negative regulator of GroEL
VFSDEFRTRLGNKVVWLKLDVASDPRILTQFGIYKVPAVLLLSAKGEEQRKFIGQFTQEQIESAISGIK